MTTPEYRVIDPTTGERGPLHPMIDDAELDAAIGRAHAAHAAWRRTGSVAERATIIRRIGDLHAERRDELAGIIVREMGKPLDQAIGEVDFSAAIYAYYADNAEDLLADDPIALLEGDGEALVRRQSLGVLLGIMPWNYPYYQVARFAGPNLLIGNTVLLKHAPQCPDSAAAVQQIFDDAGVPDGAYVNVYASHEQVETIIADPRVQGVSLTGSGRAGAAVAEIAGRNLKKVVLELGGSDPFLVLAVDNLDAVVEAAVTARLDNAGQACNAAKRFIVLDEVYEPFLARFTEALTAVRPGHPALDGTAMGPLSSEQAAARLEAQVRRAVEQGATLVAGERSGTAFAPGILTDISPGNDVRHDELFGPIASIYRAASEDEAIALANDTPYGLGAYVFSDDPEQARRVADRIEAGMVFVNIVAAESVELPFGGVKASGFGRELGRLGANEFVNHKVIRIGG